jgi:hypothetical protein
MVGYRTNNMTGIFGNGMVVFSRMTSGHGNNEFSQQSKFSGAPITDKHPCCMRGVIFTRK